jgi:hypothetical protein
MSVHHNHISGPARDQSLVGMRRRRIWQNVLWQSARSVCAGHITRRAVFSRKIVEQPDDVANRIALFVGQRARVAMQRLRPVGTRARGTGVQTAQLEIMAEREFNAGQQLRLGDRPPEDFVIINQVSQPVGLRLLFEFVTRAVAQLGEQFRDAASKSGESGGLDEVLQNQKAVVIEPIFFFRAERNLDAVHLRSRVVSSFQAARILKQLDSDSNLPQESFMSQ